MLQGAREAPQEVQGGQAQALGHDRPTRSGRIREEGIKLALAEEAQGGGVIQETLAIDEVHLEEVNAMSVLEHGGVQDAPLSNVLFSKTLEAVFQVLVFVRHWVHFPGVVFRFFQKQTDFGHQRDDLMPPLTETLQYFLPTEPGASLLRDPQQLVP